MSLLDRLGETQLGLGGVRPANLPSSKNTSKTHATDPVHGKRGDEKVSFNSEYDRDGGTPKTLSFSLGTSNTHINDPDAVANPQFVHQVTPRSTVLSRRTNNTVSFDSKYDLDGKTPETSPFASRTSPTHVIDPDAIKDIQNDPILGKNTKIQKIMQGIRRANNTLVAQSNFDLDGKTPSKLSSAFRNSNTHVQDPNANDPTDNNLSREQVLANRTNNVLKAKSDFDLDGKTPSTLSSAFRSSNTHVNDPNANDPTDVNLSREQVLANRTNNVLKAQSDFDLDGKTPSILPSATRSSATHVYDPDFSINQINDPLLNLRGSELKTAQNSRRANNTVMFKSVFSPPPEGSLGGFYPSRKYNDAARNGRGGSNFELNSGVTGGSQNFQADSSLNRDLNRE